MNPNLPTGDIEVRIGSLEVLSKADELPLPVFGEPDYPEEIRLKYRFLDLRRETIHRNIMKRSAIVSSIRRRMTEEGFFEFQTPIDGFVAGRRARFSRAVADASRQVLALPQAPQQFKQLIMIAGFDRYFQIAPCFRDEDARADRSPGEFYQLDIEMSFVTQEDVFQAVEPVLRGLFEEFGEGKPVTQTFSRVPYDEAIAKYGTDKPDLRNPILMQDVSEHFRGSGFKVFAGMLEKDPKVRVWAIPAPGGGSRAFCDRMNSWAQQQGQPGLGYIFFRKSPLPEEACNNLGHPLRVIADRQSLSPIARAAVNSPSGIASGGAGWTDYIAGSGPIANNIGAERTEAVREQLGLKEGDAVFFVGGDPAKFYKFAGEARTKVGNELNLTAKDRLNSAGSRTSPSTNGTRTRKRSTSRTILSQCRKAGWKPLRRRRRRATKRCSRSRRINTTLFATAWNCPPAQSES